MPPHGLLFPISSKGSFICQIRKTRTKAFGTTVVEHWLEREIVLTMELHLVPKTNKQTKKQKIKIIIINK